MRIVFLALATLTLMGCTRSMAKLTMASSRPLPSPMGWVSMQKGKEPVRGESTRHYVFLFMLGTPTIDEAMKDAITRCQCDLLVDANIDYSYFVVPFLYGKSTITVTGRPVRLVQPQPKAAVVVPPSGLSLPQHLRPKAASAVGQPALP